MRLKMYTQNIKLIIVFHTIVVGVLPKKTNTSVPENYGYLVANDCRYTTEQADDLPYAEGNDFTFPENSIYFIETSCNGGLSFRQACSVESAARAHLHRQVNVLFTVPITKKRLKRRPLRGLLKYPNIKLYRIHLDKYGKGTPLKSLMRHELLQSTKFIHHAADVLKFLTLYKFGGISVDLDVIVVKSFDTLPQSKINFVGKEDRDTFSTAVLAFSNDRLGRIFANETVHLLKYEFNPHARVANGEEILRKAITAVFKRYKFHVTTEKRNIVMELLDPSLNFAIYSSNYFNPIHYTDFEEFFLPGVLNLTDVYGANTYNSISRFMYITENSVFANLASQFCPKVYKQYKFKLVERNLAKMVHEASLTERTLKFKDSKEVKEKQ